MNKIFKGVGLFSVAVIVFIFTFLKTPEEISGLLYRVTSETRVFAIVIHLIVLLLLIGGIVMEKRRNLLFSVLLLLLSGSALFFSVFYLIIPNIVIFFFFFLLTLIYGIRGELNFEIISKSLPEKLVGMNALFFGFVYLHWVEPPVLLNAWLLSPLGMVNCPTMVFFCGILCFLQRDKAVWLEFFVSLITLYFGFFGVMRLDAWVDVVLILSGLFLHIRRFKGNWSEIYS